MRVRSLVSLLSVALPLAAACGGKQPAPPAPIEREPPPDVVQPEGGDGYGGDEYGYGGGEYGGGEYGGGYGEYVPPPPAPPVLAGRWVSPCFPGMQKGSFQKLTFDFTADRWDLAFDTFSDAACAKRTVNAHMTGTYGFGAQSAAVAGAWDANFTFDARDITAFDKKAVKAVGKACKLKKLKAGVKADVHAAGCVAYGMQPSATCTNDFDIAMIDNGKLRFGARPADNNMCTEDKRPTALDPQLALDYDFAGSGLAECGNYMAALQAFSTCDKVPQESRDAMMQGWAQMMDGLRSTAAVPEQRQMANDACKQGTDALSQAAAAMGC